MWTGIRPGQCAALCSPWAPGSLRSPEPTGLVTRALRPQVFEILLSRGYSENSFREDLKNLFLKLGIENKTMIFLFTDAHVAEEGFLELINNMLTSGARLRDPGALPTLSQGHPILFTWAVTVAVRGRARATERPPNPCPICHILLSFHENLRQEPSLSDFTTKETKAQCCCRGLDEHILSQSAEAQYSAPAALRGRQ